MVTTMTANPAGCAGTVMYQWQKNGVNFATTQTITLSGPGTYSVVVQCTDTVNCNDSEALSIPCDPIGTNISTAGGQLTRNVTSGCTSYSTSWTGTGGFTSTSPSITPTVADGVYTVTVTCNDSNSQNTCTGTSTYTCGINVTASQPTASTLTASATGCSGGSYTYTWTGPSGYTGSGQTISPPTNGNYTVTATCSTSGCFDTSTIAFANGCAALTASINESSVQMHASATGCTGGTFSYSWSGPSGFTAATQSITPPLPSSNNLYSVTALCTGGVNNGCTAGASNQCDAIAATIVRTNDTLTCNASGCSPSSYTYLWSTGATSSSIVATAPGVYTCTARCADNGCAIQASYTHTCQTTVSISPTGGSLQALYLNCSSPTGATYEWSTGATTSSIVPPIPSSGLTYDVEFTCAAGINTGCVATGSYTCPTITVNITGLNKQLTASATGCSPVTYSWTGPGGFTATTATINPTTSGTYNVTVRCTSSGCSGTQSYEFDNGCDYYVYYKVAYPNILSANATLTGVIINGVNVLSTTYPLTLTNTQTAIQTDIGTDLGASNYDQIDVFFDSLSSHRGFLITITAVPVGVTIDEVRVTNVINSVSYPLTAKFQRQDDTSCDRRLCTFTCTGIGTNSTQKLTKVIVSDPNLSYTSTGHPIDTASTAGYDISIPATATTVRTTIQNWLTANGYVYGTVTVTSSSITVTNTDCPFAYSATVTAATEIADVIYYDFTDSSCGS